MHGSLGFFGSIFFLFIAFPMFMPLAAAPFTWLGMFIVARWIFRKIRRCSLRQQERT